METFEIHYEQFSVNAPYRIDTELSKLFRFWILRMMFDLGNEKSLFDRHGFADDHVAKLFGLEAYLDQEIESEDRQKILAFLRKKHADFESKKKSPPLPKRLKRNIKKLSKLMHLNRTEKRLLAFALLLDQYKLLGDASDMLGDALTTSDVVRMLSVILRLPIQKVTQVLAPDGKLSRASVLTLERDGTGCMERKFDLLSEAFVDAMVHQDTDILTMLKDSIRPCDAGTTELEDYPYLSDDLAIMLPYLRQALTRHQSGVNVLLYGVPGTGKTELVKAVARHLDATLLEVSYADEADEPIDGTVRIKAYKSAQYLLSNRKTLLLYDEAEDIFERKFDPFGTQRQNNKAWINRVLESNTLATFWITNNIQTLDPAIARRFDMVIEVPLPTRSQREHIIRDQSRGLLEQSQIEQLAHHEAIAPALVSRAAKVIESIELADPQRAFVRLIDQTLRVQGHSGIRSQQTSDDWLAGYDPGVINTTIDLETLSAGIAENPNARLCLYGPPGTGKSAFGQYIARRLDRPFLLRKGSDLLSKWVGGTEQNIAQAFEEANRDGAVLLFDEVDSFLRERASAHNSWEVTQVNEMLVQMERFDGVFVATTNLMDGLDRASLRRFDLKLKFDYLRAEQAWKLFKNSAQAFGLSRPPKYLQTAIEAMRFLTPGDFAALRRQHRFRPFRDWDEVLDRLRAEVAIKHETTSTPIGFLS